MDARLPKGKLSDSKNRFKSEGNVSRCNVADVSCTPRLSAKGVKGLTSAYSEEDLLKSMDNLHLGIISRRNMDARVKDLKQRQDTLHLLVTRENSTRRVLANVIDSLSLIKQTEEILIRKLAGQYEIATADQQIRVGKNLKHSERKMKQLQYHMMRLEQLEEHYKMKAELRLAARRLIESLKVTSGSDAKTAKREAHDQINMLTTEMCEIENKIEAEYLGKWKINIDCLVGCTLLMPGDEYKVKFVFGSQKWKTRCKMRRQSTSTNSASGSFGDSNGQDWTSSESVFYPMFGTRLLVSVKVSRGRLKFTSDLGQISIDTDDFFQPDQKVEMHNITRSGALKLRFSVLWNWALEDENYVPSLAALDRYIPEESGSLGSGGSEIGRSEGSNGSGYRVALQGSFKSEHSDDNLPSNRLTVALHNVTLCIDQVYGHFTILHNLEKQIRIIVQTYFPENERFTEIHFTNPEYAFISDDESSSTSSSHRKYSSGKTNGIVTGCRNVDQLLLTHLYSCLPQFKYLDSQPPMERKKNKALEKLAFHGLVFEKILRYLKVKSKTEITTENELLVMIPELGQSEQLQLFWNVLEKSCSFLCNVGSIIRQLEKLFAHKFASLLSPEMSVTVFDTAASRLIGERSRDDKNSLISVFSFYQNMGKEFQGSPEVYIGQIVKEVLLTSKFSEASNLKAGKFLDIVPPLAGHIPHAENWRQISLLFADCQNSDHDLASEIHIYFNSISDVVVRKKVIGFFLEQLEENSSADICAAASCLSALRADVALHQLAFLANHHDKQKVRYVCRESAYSFGANGRNLVQFYANPINHLSQTQRKFQPKFVLPNRPQVNVHTLTHEEEVIYL